MARMIPDVDLAQLEHSSEKPVYRALRDVLGDGLPRPFTPIPGSGRCAARVLSARAKRTSWSFIPSTGCSSLRSKAETGSGTMVAVGSATRRRVRRKFRDPFLQAQRNLHALVDIVQQRSGNRVKRNDFVYGYAVVFPHLDYEGDPPPHADRAIVISRRHLPFMEQAVMTAFRAWTTCRRELHRDRFATMLDCLMPKFRIFPAGWARHRVRH